MDNLEYEDQELDELAYGRCRWCHQIEELNADDECLVCEGRTRALHRIQERPPMTTIRPAE